MPDYSVAVAFLVIGAVALDIGSGFVPDALGLGVLILLLRFIYKDDLLLVRSY